MERSESWEEKVRSLQDKVQKLLESPFWQKSFILKKQQTDMQKALDEVAVETKTLAYSSVLAEDHVKAHKSKQDLLQNECNVYVVLHQTAGQNMELWQRALHAIESCGFGRPIYEKEEYARRLVSANGAKDTDAYVEITVKNDDVIHGQEESMLDKLEQPMVTTRPGRVKSDKIKKFVHHNDINYVFINGKLHLDAEA